MLNKRIESVTESFLAIIHNNKNMKIKTLFKTIFCVGLVLTLVLYLCHLYGNYIEKTQEPITGYTYNGFKEKSNYKSSNTILITYKSKQYALHTGDRVLDKIKSGDFPKLYYSSKTDYLFLKEIICLSVMPKQL